MSPPPDPPRRDAGPAVVGADTGDVAFLDAPGMTTDALFTAVGRVLAGMPAGAILTVYTDDPAAVAEAPAWCARRDVALLAVISHDEHDGATLAVCRTRPAEPVGQGDRSPSEGRTAPTEPPRHPRLPPKT